VVKELIISSVGYVGERVGKRAKNGKERFSDTLVFSKRTSDVV